VAAYPKPLPVPELDTQPFWDACAQHELRAQRCTSCGKFRWPPGPLCAHCRSWDSEWVKLDGTDGAVRLTSNIVDYPTDQVNVSMRVVVVWEDATPEISLPKFRPVE